MAEATATIDFKDGLLVEFSARGRNFANDRAKSDDGPVGFNSGELILLALSNCALGVLCEDERMQSTNIRRVTVNSRSEVAQDPTRIVKLSLGIDIETDDGGEYLSVTDLTNIALNCPVANSLRQPPVIDIDIRISS